MQKRPPNIKQIRCILRIYHSFTYSYHIAFYYVYLLNKLYTLFARKLPYL